MKKFYILMALASVLSSSVFGMDEKEKTGFFAGVDISTANYLYGDSGSAISIGAQPRTTFNYGLKGGYQFYFTPKQGVRVGAHFIMGNYVADAKAIVSPYGGSSSKSTSSSSGTDTTLKASYFGLRYGIDMDYLYDFYNSNHTSIGISAGFGYELANFVAGEITSTSSSKGTSKTTKVKNSLFGTGAYLNLGAHYYYSNHQVEFGLRMPFSVFTPENYMASGATKNDITSGSTTTSAYQYGLISPSSSVHLSYSYRF